MYDKAVNFYFFILYLYRCINAVIGGSEYVRMEREMKRKSMSNGNMGEAQQSEPLNRASIEANIKSSMQLFVKCASLIVLDSWTENSRYFLQVCCWYCMC
jgi:NCK-associated protein 1